MHRNRLLDLDYGWPDQQLPRPRPVAAMLFLLWIVAGLVAANLALLVHHFGPDVLRILRPW